MNIFSQYGIREVADVMLYSIKRIGTEEFYLPVLYLDTLKVSTVEKPQTVTPQFGGKGNTKIISWSYDKEIKLKLEDALFSNTSLNVYMNGRVEQDMSDWTSAIAKLSVANKYGRNHYSVKAYPSPEITDDEWEIIYRCAQKAGFDPRTGAMDNDAYQIGYNRLDDYDNHAMKYVYDNDSYNKDINVMVAENRWLLKTNYYHRTQKTPRNRDISPFFDINNDKYESVSIVLKDLPLAEEHLQAEGFAPQPNDTIENNLMTGSRPIVITYADKADHVLQKIDNEEIYLYYQVERRPTGLYATQLYISTGNLEGGDADTLKDIILGYNKEEEDNPTYEVGDTFLLSHLPYYLFPHYLEVAIGNLCWCDLNDITEYAMPQEIIDKIAEEISTYKETGKIVNDLYEIKAIDRFEKCVVEDRNGMDIDLQEQMANVKKYYANEQSTFTVFWDYKNMLPFMDKRTLDYNITKQKCVRLTKEKGAPTPQECFDAIKGYLEDIYSDDWLDELTIDDVIINRVTQRDTSSKYHYVYFNVTKREYIHLKYGTIYYKMTRTMDEDNNDITFLGTELSIDSDTFSGEYMLVGETVIRNQMTGRDEQFQFVINRATISSTSKLNLQSKGDSTTFSLDVAVLQPDNGPMMELRMFKTEPDKVEGGTRIVPQSKRHVVTPLVKIKEEIVIDNNEIY